MELGCTVALVKYATAYIEVIMHDAQQFTGPFCAGTVLAIDGLIAVLPHG